MDAIDTISTSMFTETFYTIVVLGFLALLIFYPALR
jgi:hypothetical protein